jgi:hypothetical protein
MNNLTMTATILGKPQTSQTHEKALRARFSVQSDGGELPLRFLILAYGHQAQTASELQDGDEVMVSGRMVVNEGTRTMAVICNALEFLFEGEQANGTSAEQNVSTKT